MTTINRTAARAFAAGVLSLALCAGLSSPASAFLDKTRFLAHVGVAYYAFHHWVLTPYRNQQFASGAPHRTSSLVKGGIALLFAAHEVRVAEKIAHNSKDPLLQKLDSGIAGLTGSFSGVGQRLKQGKFSPGDVESLDGAASSVASTAAAAGSPIKDVPAKIPGL